MYARVVRFTDVTDASIAGVSKQVEESDGPPPGVEAKEMKLLHDPDQRTALFVAFFDSAEAMAAAEEVFGSMDTGDTPGTRVSVDRCAVVIEETGR